MSESSRISRRAFLGLGIGGAAAGIAGGVGLTVLNSPPAQDNALPPASPTDPTLIHYQPVARFSLNLPDVRRIAVAPRNRLAIAHAAGVMLVEADGSVHSSIPTPQPARALAFAPAGQLLVAVDDHIETFNDQGQRLALWNPPSPGAVLTAIAADEEHVFLADAAHALLWRCRPDGSEPIALGRKDEARNIPGFIVPSPFFDLRLGPDGLLWATNPGRHRVEAYTHDGDFEHAWGQPSSAIEGFCGCCNPIALAFLDDRAIVTAEKGLPRVKIYNPGGDFRCVVCPTELFTPEPGPPTPDAPRPARGSLDIAVAPDGRIWVLDRVAGVVHAMALRTPGHWPAMKQG